VTGPAARRRPAGCPSSLALDELLAGDLEGQPEEAPLREHVAHCADCRAQLDARAADPVLAPDPVALRPWLESDLAVARARRRRRASRWIAAAGSAAAAGLLLFTLRGGPRAPAGEERTKGALALTLHVKRASAAGAAPATTATASTATIEQINGEGQLRAGDEVRFSLSAARAGHAVVLGLDATPSVTIYVPAAAGAGGAPSRAIAIAPPGPVILAGSVVADATPGFERMVAVVCQQETAPETLRRQAQVALARAGGRPEAVSSLGTGCLESSVLLRKGQP
jgi:hypothetical protein